MYSTDLSRRTHWRLANVAAPPRRRFEGANLHSFGFSLLELLISLAIILVMAAIALPFLYGNRRTYHLTQASTAAAGAIEATRYKTIMAGCNYSVTFTAGSTNYQVQTQTLTGTPPACSATWSNVGAATPWSTSSDVTMTPTSTIQFSPDGTVTATAGSRVLVFSNGFTTNTVSVSGVGNVRITQP